MMADQWIRDWDGRFLSGETPWEEETPSSEMQRMMRKYVAPGSPVVEIGCGRGTNAIWLAGNGYAVTAVDVSKEAIRQARQKAESQRVDVDWVVADILDRRIRVDPPAAVFDKGCFHSFNTARGQRAFAKAVATLLEPGGLWIDISGSADHPDDPGEARRCGFPRVSAARLAGVVERDFEILELGKCRFGTTLESDFLAWSGAFRKR